MKRKQKQGKNSTKMNLKLDPNIETLIDMPTERSDMGMSQREKQLSNVLSKDKFNVKPKSQARKRKHNTRSVPKQKKRLRKYFKYNNEKEKQKKYEKSKKDGKIFSAINKHGRSKNNRSLSKKFIETRKMIQAHRRHQSHFFSGNDDLDRNDFISSKDRFFMKYRASDRKRRKKKPKLKILNLNSFVDFKKAKGKIKIHSPDAYTLNLKKSKKRDKSAENFFRDHFQVPVQKSQKNIKKKKKLKPMLSPEKQKMFYNLTHNKFKKNSKNPFFIGPMKRLALQYQEQLNHKNQKRSFEDFNSSKIFAKRVLFEDQQDKFIKYRENRDNLEKTKEIKSYLSFNELKKNMPTDQIVNEMSINSQGYFYYKEGGELSNALGINKMMFPN